jgi:serine/threonine protein kinase
MGEVYRARDTRLKRDVALKVLVGAAAEDSGRFRRFQSEAESTAALSHPNIVAVYDIGQENGAPYIVSELVVGGTLSSLLARGPLAATKLLDLAVPIAEGLAAAHARGIVHRDLKPDNVLLTADGSPKIADFGLAKYFRPAQDDEGSHLTTLTDDRTKEGTIVGTVSYMSPEQAKGEPIDFRSDQFSFGSVLYEMATGKRPFRRQTAVQTLAAIVQEEPEPIAKHNSTLPAPLRWIIERNLSKEPRQRYASTEELVHDLASVREHFSEISGSGESYASQTRRRSPFFVVALAAAIAAAAAIGDLARSSASSQTKSPSFHRLTFRRGNVSGARFAPDGRTIVYSAAWDGKPSEIFLTRRESSDSRALGFRGAHLWSVSREAELALATDWQVTVPDVGIGTLARTSLLGGEVRKLVEGVEDADWSPDGKSLAITRRQAKRSWLEFPVGRKLYEHGFSPFWGIRISPKGDLVAFIDQTQNVVTEVAVVDTAGKKRTLSSGWFRAQGVSWSHDGKEVWFTGAKAGSTARALWAITLSGRERLVTEVPGRLRLEDISADGSVLLAHETVRREMVGLAPGETRERDLTWLGYSFPENLSRDGRTLLFSESGEGSGLAPIYVRGTDGSPPIRIGNGERPLRLRAEGGLLAGREMGRGLEAGSGRGARSRGASVGASADRARRTETLSRRGTRNRFRSLVSRRETPARRGRSRRKGVSRLRRGSRRQESQASHPRGRHSLRDLAGRQASRESGRERGHLDLPRGRRPGLSHPWSRT